MIHASKKTHVVHCLFKLNGLQAPEFTWYCTVFVSVPQYMIFDHILWHRSQSHFLAFMVTSLHVTVSPAWMSSRYFYLDHQPKLCQELFLRSSLLLLSLQTVYLNLFKYIFHSVSWSDFRVFNFHTSAALLLSLVSVYCLYFISYLFVFIGLPIITATFILLSVYLSTIIFAPFIFKV